jgi:hypothetical protein
MSLKNSALIVLLGGAALLASLSGCSTPVSQAEQKQNHDIEFTMHRYPANAGKDECVHVTKRLMSLAEYHPLHGSTSLIAPEFAYLFKQAPCQIDSLPLDSTLVPYNLQVL